MFQILPLSADAFAPLYGMSDTDLMARGVVAETADKKPGFPCRVSLGYAEPGERVLLLNHVYQPAATPFHGRHAIYVRDGAVAADLRPNELPGVFRVPTTLSVRAFDAHGMLKTAELAATADCAEVFARLLAREDVAELHIHYAAYGCFAARAVRA